MSNPYIGEIRLFAGNFAPQGWAFCDGSVLPISEFEALFNLIGTTYGGDGQQTFSLPDMRGRVPVHQGQGSGLSSRVMGQLGGSETITLTPVQLPSHNHILNATTAAAVAGAGAANDLTATASTTQFYGSTPGGGALAAQALLPSGAGLAHNNMAPFLAVSFIISLFGVFPSQN